MVIIYDYKRYKVDNYLHSINKTHIYKTQKLSEATEMRTSRRVTGNMQRDRIRKEKIRRGCNVK